MLSAYSASSIKLIKAIAKEKCVKEINAEDFIKKYKLKVANNVNTALKKLIDKELVYKTLEGYIVYGRLWLFS